MAEKTKYFVLKKKGGTGGLLKVVEAKRLLDSGKAASVQEAAENVASAAALFINTKMIFFRSMIMQKERRSPW